MYILMSRIVFHIWEKIQINQDWPYRKRSLTRIQTCSIMQPREQTRIPANNSLGHVSVVKKNHFKIAYLLFELFSNGLSFSAYWNCGGMYTSLYTKQGTLVPVAKTLVRNSLLFLWRQRPHLHGGYSQKLNDDRHVCLVSRSTFLVVIGKYHYNTAYNIQIGTFTRFVYLINSQSEYINKRKLED